MIFDKHDPKDFEAVLSGNYFIRDGACERILKAYGIIMRVYNIRRVFTYITGGKDSNSPTAEEIAQFKIGRENLMQFIENYGKQLNYAELSKEELNEALLDEGYKDPPSLEIIRQLLHYGADINVTDKMGFPAFVRSMEARDYESLKLFLEQGANVNYVYPKLEKIPNDYRTYWLLNIAATPTPNILLMMEYGANVLDKRHSIHNALHIIASSKADIEVVKIFIEKGVGIDDLNDSGQSPLHLFCENPNNLPCIVYLLEKGANPNILDNDGYSPLHKAVLRQYDASETIKMLVQFGINIDQTDYRGHTALSLAINKEAEASVKTLIEQGASTKIPLADGSSAYDLALSKGFVKIATLLNPDAEKDYSARPEFQQIQKLKEEIIKALKMGRGWSSSDKEGWSSFEYIDGVYVYDSGEHFSDDKYNYSLDSNEKALEFLYGRLGYGDKQNSSELENWKKVLNWLR